MHLTSIGARTRTFLFAATRQLPWLAKPPKTPRIVLLITFTVFAPLLAFAAPAAAATMSGTLTLASSSCTIAAGASACNVSLTWSTTNPVATSKITSSWPSANTTVFTGNSGTNSAPVPPSGRAFFLYNNGLELARRTATASCVSGTTWNGSTCQKPMSGTLTLASSSCAIAAGAGTCNVSLTWSTTNPVATSKITSSWPSANTTVFTGNSGANSAPVPPSGRAFFLYNNGLELARRTATASCVSGTTWNGSTCQKPMSGTLTLASSSCTIAAGAGTCNVSLTWSTTNPVATSKVTSSWPSANTTVFTGNSGANSAPVPPSGRAFFLYNNGLELASRTATASCVSGTTWNGSTCQAPMSGTLTPTAPSCTIAAGANLCNVTLAWTTTNPVGISKVTSNTPVANTQVGSGNAGTTTATVPYNSRIFFLYNNGIELASRTATASCVSGTTWNGSTCQAAAMSGTLTASAASCTIAAGAGTCNVSLSWSTTNPVLTSAVTSSYPSANTPVATGNSGGPLSVSVPYPSRAFYLNNNGVELASRTVTSSCTSGTTWNGSTCQAPTVPTLISPPDKASLLLAASNMSVTLQWTSVIAPLFYNLDVFTGSCSGTAFAHYQVLPVDPSKTLTGLNSGTTYYWRVQSVSVVGTSESSCSSFSVTANQAPTLRLTSKSGTPVAAGPAGMYTIVVHAADADGNLSNVDINWNDSTPVERQTVSGNQADVTFTRAFDTVRTIDWSVNAYDTTGDASKPTLTGTFGVTNANGTLPNQIDGSAFRYTNGVREDTRVFIRRVNDSTSIVPTIPTWIVIHGRDSNFAAMKQITDAVSLVRNKGDQVLVLNWKDAADGLLYSDGEAWIQPVGEWAAKTLFAYGFRGSDLNLIGHSWGSYVADELAELMPLDSAQGSLNKVNSIVALDPAINTPGPYDVDVVDTVDFHTFSNCSWAFHVHVPGVFPSAGSAYTPTTASEAFAVVYDKVSVLAHSKVKDLFAYMIQHSTQDPSKHFQLDRLVPCQDGPWLRNGYNSDGDPQADGGYEGKIYVTDAGSPSFSVIPYKIDSDSLPAVTLTLTSTSGTSVTTGQTYTIAVTAADVDGRLSNVDVNWNDGTATPVESQVVSGSSASVTFARAFSTARTINWSATAYDASGTASNQLTGTFSVTAPVAVPSPTVTTGAASAITQTSATLNGIVNPNGALTTTGFDYGTTTGYGSVVAAQTLTGSSAQGISTSVALACEQLYHARARGTNSGGTNSGADITFTTSACSTAPPGSFSKATPTNGATGQPTSVTLGWGTSSNAASYEYCVDTTNNSSCDGTWTSTGTAVSATLSGLSAGTTHYWQVRANNAGGPTYANGSSFAHWSFTTAAPSLDLTVSSLNNPPGSVSVGASFNATDTTANQGSSTAGASTTRYRLSTDSTITSVDPLLTGIRAVPSLAAGGTSSGGVTVTVPAGTTPATYYLGACADDLGAVTEANETNNCRASATTVQVSSVSLPNLTPYQPAGWSDKIVVSRTTATNTDAAGLTTSDVLYLDWAVLNNGAAPIAAQFYTGLYVDGSLRASWYTAPPMNANTYTYVGDYALGALSAGTHTLEIRTDSTSVISESNESDNQYTKTITVSGVSLPNLTPYQPAGWSDKLVVSRTTGTNIDASGLRTSDVLYLDWAVLNNGVAPTATQFYTALYVDGSLRATWFSAPPMNANTYAYVADYALGALSAGTHTLQIRTDSTSVISESNESDNQYTKTIVVQ